MQAPMEILMRSSKVNNILENYLDIYKLNEWDPQGEPMRTIQPVKLTICMIELECKNDKRQNVEIFKNLGQTVPVIEWIDNEDLFIYW